MVWRSRILFTSLLTALIAVLLSLLPAIDPPAGEMFGSPAFRTSGAERLSADNLPDWLARMPFELIIRRADWREPILDLDLVVPAQDLSAGAVYRDLYRLTQSAFYDETNVRQVLVRVLAPVSPSSGMQLLLSMDARKDQLPKHEQKLNIGSTLELQEYLQTYCRLAFSGFWGQRFTTS